MPSFSFQERNVVDASISTLVDSLVTTEPSTMLFVDMMADLQRTTAQLDAVRTDARVLRQRHATLVEGQTTSPTRKAWNATDRQRRKTITADSKATAEPSKKARRGALSTNIGAQDGTRAPAKAINRERLSSTSTTNCRKKDEDALDCIYTELQASVGMCRYWGKKCWNLRVPKAKGGFHSLCHAHRVKANDNQRRFDYKRRGTLWRSFTPDPNYVDISLFPGEASSSEVATEDAVIAITSFEPFEVPEPLQDKDVALLRELMGSALI